MCCETDGAVLSAGPREDPAGRRHSRQDRPAAVHRPAALRIPDLPLRALERCADLTNIDFLTHYPCQRG